MILNMIVWTIVLGILLYGVFVLLSKLFGEKGYSSIEILRERFARGEINEEEFKEKEAILRSKE